MPNETTRPRAVIGWREWAGLPALGLTAVKAKIDTGARTASLHATGLRTFQRDGRTWVAFTVRPEQRSGRGAREVEAAVVALARVRSSSGHAERRPVIRTELTLGGRTWPIELNLTDRSGLGFRLLLGRSALRGRHHVDPGRSYLLGPRPGGG